MSESPQITDENECYITPSGQVFFPGDIASAICFDRYTIYNEPIIKATCPGFSGAKLEGMGPDEWFIEPIEGDPNIFVIGPQSHVWTWVYSRGEIMKDFAIKQKQIEDSLGGEA